MSYSRWLGSNWYVFWQASKADNKEDELCAIWHASDQRLPAYTYHELKQVKDIDDLRKLIGLDLSDEEYEECLIYIKRFLSDVEEEYSDGEKC